MHCAMATYAEPFQPLSQWEILLWDIELQGTKRLGIVKATSARAAIEAAIGLLHIEDREQSERLIAVRPAC
jgi:hypothetical protein